MVLELLVVAKGVAGRLLGVEVLQGLVLGHELEAPLSAFIVDYLDL